jgi:hypothetical protein
MDNGRYIGLDHISLLSNGKHGTFAFVFVRRFVRLSSQQ